MTPERIGILGGTFDPIHVGHLEAAQAARDMLQLSRVLLLPSRTPPHRSIEPRASVFHRFAMAALTAAEREGMEVSDLEVGRAGPSYTSETLSLLISEGVSPAQLFFVIGADAFAEIETWHDYPHILSLANFVVVSRPGFPVADPRRPDPSTSTSVLSIEASTPDVSATEIRRRVAANEPLAGLVVPCVAQHIRRHRLYVPAETAEAL